ncbi:hypothetical protein F5B18DRAFT_569495 [Nemania serpens]|nr:hypothetical protein F5B18DRAFT_569495 [Nemania serpens]
MPCCGSDSDYYSEAREGPKPYRPVGPSQRYPQTERRGLSREEIEKRQRQAQATAAAQSYGWPTRGVTPTGPHRTHGSRDSIIESGLVGSLAALPGSDLRAVYDPQRIRQPPHQQQLRQQPRQQPGQQPRQQPGQQPGQQRPIHQPTWPQRPPYYQFISEQPSKVQPMSTPSRHRTQTGPPVIKERIARKPVLHAAQPHLRPHTAKLVRRDSNGISECSDDEDGVDYREKLRNYTVSPL